MPIAILSEWVGYLASALVFLTFCMKTMIPLRLVAIGSNVAFISYGAIAGLAPILILHVILLPLNLLRLRQSIDLTRAVRQSADGDLSLDWLLPHMRRESRKAGDYLFRKGDRAYEMYYLARGEVVVEEFGVQVGPGEIFGEISLFSRDARRTASIRCLTDADLMSITDKEVKQLYFQNPRFGFYLVQLITARLIDNIQSQSALDEVDQMSHGDPAR